RRDPRASGSAPLQRREPRRLERGRPEEPRQRGRIRVRDRRPHCDRRGPQRSSRADRQHHQGPASRMYSRIAGTGSYLPERVLTNFDLEKMVDTSDEWIRTRTGIERRHIADENETTSDLAYRAAVAAMESAGVDGADIDLVLV